MSLAPARPPSPTAESVELVVGGMTCGACSARIEKKLNRLDGVEASVNFATGAAHVAPGAEHTVDDLVAVIEKLGYTAQPVPDPDEAPATETAAGSGTTTDRPDAALKARFIACAVLAAPVVVLSMVPAWQFPNWQWLALTLSAPVAVWGAAPLHRAAWTNARHRTATMDTLVSIGVTTAFGWSLWALFLAPAGDARSTLYLDVAAAVTTFVLAGRFLEARSRRRAGAAVTALLELGARDVAVLPSGSDDPAAATRVPLRELRVGRHFVVLPGERIATDGVVVRGSSAVDAAAVTGESVPVEVGVQSPVTGGTINVGGRLVVRATRIGSDTLLARIRAQVSAAQSGKARAQRLADRVAGVFVPVVLAAAAATVVVRLLLGEPVAEALPPAIAVLVVACPCAMGLATPTALLVATGRGAQLGILIGGPEALESSARIDTVVLDKTGTLTTGTMTVVETVTARHDSPEEVLAAAGAIEEASEHPIGRAIATHARTVLGRLPAPVEDVEATAGRGISGRLGTVTVTVARPEELAASSGFLPPELNGAVADARRHGATPVAVAWAGRLRGVLVLRDVAKPESARAVAELGTLAVTPILLTGDTGSTAHALAGELGINTVVADVLPGDKVGIVELLRRQGNTVAMVGDGVNDAGALAAADLGLAMGTGTDAAIEAADITLVGGNPQAAVTAIRLARRTLHVIRTNLVWAFAYNAVALPLAAAGLLDPVIGGAAMAMSSVLVVANSLRLRRFGPPVPGPAGRHRRL